jgi:ribosomal protein L27
MWTTTTKMCAMQGCQIFLGTKYQNGENIPNGHKIYVSNGNKIYPMAVK